MFKVESSQSTKPESKDDWKSWMMRMQTSFLFLRIWYFLKMLHLTQFYILMKHKNVFECWLQKIVESWDENLFDNTEIIQEAERVLRSKCWRPIYKLQIQYWNRASKSEQRKSSLVPRKEMTVWCRKQRAVVMIPKKYVSVWYDIEFERPYSEVSR